MDDEDFDLAIRVTLLKEHVTALDAENKRLHHEIRMVKSAIKIVIDILSEYEEKSHTKH